MGIKISRPAPPPQVAQKDEELKDTPVAGDDASEVLEVEQLASEVPASEPAAEEPAPPAKPSPKTSPSPYLGMPVLHRTQDKARQYNGSDVHPGVITHVWERCVNIKVLPDCGATYDATSQQRIAYSDVEGQGWFTVDEARSA